MNEGFFCVGLIVMKCFTAQPVPVDSYCSLYDKVIVEQGDSKIIAPVGVKKRLLANELKFKKFCGSK